jgi:hypothetical protein
MSASTDDGNDGVGQGSTEDGQVALQGDNADRNGGGYIIGRGKLQGRVDVEDGNTVICVAGAAAIAAIGVAENAATAETNNCNGSNESDTKKQEREILMAESKALLSRSSARAVLPRCSLIPDYQHMHRSRNGVGAVVGGEG